MGIHRFIEVEDGQTTEVKRILYAPTSYNKKEHDANKEYLGPLGRNMLAYWNTLTVLCKNKDIDGSAESIALSIKRAEGLKMIESYHLSKFNLCRYGEVKNITPVIGELPTNWNFKRVIFPFKYTEYDIYQIEYMYTYEQVANGSVDCSLLSGKDEIYFNNREYSFSTFLN